MRFVVALLVLCASIPARAEDLEVVVVPFTSPDESTAMFGKPVADAVAAALDERQDVAARVVAEDGKPDGHVVVELRVAKGKKKNRLELSAVARELDGAEVAQVTSKPVAVADLDRAATQVAKLLAPKIDAVAARPRKERPKPPPPPVVEAPKPRSQPPQPPPQVVPEEPADARPVLAVYQPDGKLGAELARPIVHAFVERLGHRPVALPTGGSVAVGVAGADARAAKSAGTLMVRVVSVDFKRRGVLTARGSVRVRLVDPMGQVLLDRTVDTDTVVGAKSDDAARVTTYVLRQGLDILQREVKKALR